MNCKQGDIAVIVKVPPKDPKALGLVVKVGSFAISPRGRPAWIVELPRPVTGANGYVGRRMTCPDACLRPIRDQDGEDEILRIAGKPQEVTA